MKWLKRLVVLLVGLLLVIQVVRPARTNPPIDSTRTIEARTQMNPEIAAILDRSCNDCHSFKTRWPWYTEIAPASWLVVWDVNEAREHLSLSDWGSYNQKKVKHLLEEMNDEVMEGKMPPANYVRLHPEARLSEADKSKLLDWILAEHLSADDKGN
ncbi:MAG: heme-binding domain-containing protein [Acidobacteriota bacterium]